MFTIKRGTWLVLVPLMWKWNAMNIRDIVSKITAQKPEAHHFLWCVSVKIQKVWLLKISWRYSFSFFSLRFVGVLPFEWCLIICVTLAFQAIRKTLGEIPYTSPVRSSSGTISHMLQSVLQHYCILDLVSVRTEVLYVNIY